MTDAVRFRTWATLGEVLQARDMMRQGLGLREAAEQLGVTRAALDEALWQHIGRMPKQENGNG